MKPALHSASPMASILSSADSAAATALESAFGFTCQGQILVGLLAAPPADARALGVLFIVGGPQYRVGSHRLFVRLARRLAGQGWPAMRFDVRGMGDSTGERRPFEALSDDIAAAVEAFQQQCPAVKRVVLWGLCDAASAALLYLQERRDPRVAGLVLLNPWVRSLQTLQQAQVSHYYARRLLDPVTWAAFFRGGIRWRSLADFARTLTQVAWRRLRPVAPPAGFQQRMLSGLQGFGGPSMLVLSGQDLTAQEFLELARSSPGWSQAMAAPGVTVCHLETADHTLSTVGSGDAHGDQLRDWLAELETR